MINNAAHVCAFQRPGLTIAHGHHWYALSISFTDTIGNAGTLEVRRRFAAQGTSVPISRGSPSISSV